MRGVTLIGGYLGAGKTTLVNRLLRQANGVRLAVLVNEFGALPIDEDLIEAQDETLISIAGGCVCCSYGNDLMEALLSLQTLDPAPDHVLLETSGVALPGSIAASLALLDGYRHDATVILADAETIRAQSRDPYVGDTVLHQLGAADLLLLSKVDLSPPQTLAETTRWAQTMAPQAAVLPVIHGDIPSAVILSPERRSGAARPLPAPAKSAAFASAELVIPHPASAEEVARTLADPAFDLARAKGFVTTPDGLRTVQVVGRRWTVSPAPAGARPGLVVIAPRQSLDLPRLRAAVNLEPAASPAAATPD